MRSARRAVGDVPQRTDELNGPRRERRPSHQRPDAGKLQRAMLEIAFSTDKTGELAQRAVELLQEVFAESAVVLSIPQQGSDVTQHHALHGHAKLIESCAETPAHAANDSGLGIQVSDMRRDTRFAKHNKLAVAQDWLACCAEPLLATSGETVGVLS